MASAAGVSPPDRVTVPAVTTGVFKSRASVSAADSGDGYSEQAVACCAEYFPGSAPAAGGSRLSEITVITPQARPVRVRLAYMEFRFRGTPATRRRPPPSRIQ